MNFLVSKINRWKILIFFNAVYLAAGIAWISLIPYNNAPDENTHFHYSVEFIIQHHRLPVWGVDDIERFQHALSSYNQMPALNYVLYAAGAAAGRQIFGLEEYLGARLISLLWGLVFLNFLFLAIKEICANEKNALMITAAVALIPQVFFSFCYVNSDAHSLAIAAILGYALARFLRAQNGANIIFAGAAIGLLFSAKYNYYIYFPGIAVVLIWAALRRIVSWQSIGKLILASLMLSVLISGFWFIRNYLLYGSPLPILMSEEFFRHIALTREVHPVNHGLSIPALVWLVQQGFIGSTFDSFFAVFGYLNVGFKREVYMILEVAVPAIVFFFMIELLTLRDRIAEHVLIGLLLLVGAVIALHVWACLTFDYQAQGRYNFTVLLPIALFAGWIITRHGCLKKHAVIFLVMMVWLFVGANLLIARTYGPAAQFAIQPVMADKLSGAASGRPAKAERINKNLYATERIALAAAPAAFLRVDLPGNFLARWRDFKVELETPAGRQTADLAIIPPEYLHAAVFEPRLNALESSGQDPYFIIPLPANAKSLKISGRLEHRRLYDLE